MSCGCKPSSLLDTNKGRSGTACRGGGARRGATADRMAAAQGTKEQGRMNKDAVGSAN